LLAFRQSTRVLNGHGRFGWFLSWIGRTDEALREVNVAARLTPLGPNEIAQVAVVNYVARRYDDGHS